jgi:hypothetical protein
LRALAERLAGQASTVGESLADLLADFSGGEARLGETLEAHSLSTYTEAETGSTAQARVLGELVYESLLQLLLEAPPESKRPPTAGELEERRRQACRRARADAVDRLYEALLDERLPGAASIAVADAVAADPAVGRALRAMLEAIEPIEIPSADDERCGVTLVFDRARLADLAPP